MKNLRIRFSYFGVLIVALQAFPNIIWALFPPALNRLEGNASSVPFIEYGEHILGVAIVVLLLFLVNKTVPNKFHRTALAIISYIAIALYWLCWAMYFAGVQYNAVLYPMVLLPPLAFFCAGLTEKVWPISAASAAFLVFHTMVALENYPMGGLAIMTFKNICEGVFVPCIGFYLAAVNLLALALVVRDKRAARSGAWRIKERTLLIISAIGGSVAMLITMRLIRHKTKHAKFMVGIPVIIVLQIAVVLFVCWWLKSGMT